MQEQIKNEIDKAISENNISKIRSYLDDLRHSLINNNGDIECFLDYLTDLLNSERFLGLGGAIYVFSISIETLAKATQFQQTKLIQLLRLAQEKVDSLSIEAIKTLIFEEAINNKSIPIEDCIKVIDSRISEMNYFSEEYFILILEIIRKETFLVLEKSWELLALLQEKWSLITEKQKKQLFLELENIYGKSKNWMLDFVIVELLGEYFSNEPAFEVLSRLSKIDNEESRALVPHGFEHLIKDSENNEISTKAYQLLLKMKQDSSELVKAEVMESLNKLNM